MNEDINLKLKNLQEKQQKRMRKKHLRMKTIIKDANLGHPEKQIGMIKNMNTDFDK
jgi:hypothetical protein